jgi:hypothetical protein
VDLRNIRAIPLPPPPRPPDLDVETAWLERYMGEVIPDLSTKLKLACSAVASSDAGTAHRMVINPLVRLAYWINSLPASTHHHDTGPGGLFEHTLVVATKAAVAARQARTLPDKRITPDAYAQSAWMSGILHDLGKVAFAQVSHEQDVWATEIPLTVWLAEHRLMSYDFRYNWSLDAASVVGHTSLGLFWVRILFPPGALRLMGVSAQNAVIGSLGDRALAYAESLRAITKRADADATDAARTKATTLNARHGSGPADPYRIGDGTHLQDFIQAVQALFAEQRLSVNALRGHLYISPTHTILATPDPRTQGLVDPFDLILTHIRKVLPAPLPAFYVHQTPTRSLRSELKARAQIGPGFVVPSDAGEQGTDAIHRLTVFSPDGKAQPTVTAYLFPNGTFWTDEILKDLAPCPFQIQLTPPDGSMTIDVTDYGFVPAPTAQGSRAVTSTAAAGHARVAAPGSAHLTRVWHLLGQLGVPTTGGPTPILGDTLSEDHLEILAATIADRLSSAVTAGCDVTRSVSDSAPRGPRAPGSPMAESHRPAGNDAAVPSPTIPADMVPLVEALLMVASGAGTPTATAAQATIYENPDTVWVALGCISTMVDQHLIVTLIKRFNEAATYIPGASYGKHTISIGGETKQVSLFRLPKRPPPAAGVPSLKHLRFAIGPADAITPSHPAP